ASGRRGEARRDVRRARGRARPAPPRASELRREARRASARPPLAPVREAVVAPADRPDARHDAQRRQQGAGQDPQGAVRVHGRNADGRDGNRVTPERLQELLNAFVDDQLDAQGQRELAKALETDEQARRAFVRTSSQHQALRELMGKPAAQRRKRPAWVPLAAAAAVVIAAVTIYALTRSADAPVPSGSVVKDVKEKKPTPIPPKA